MLQVRIPAPYTGWRFAKTISFHEAAGDVDARAAAGADVRVCRALVNVLALVCHANLAVSLRADAHERSDDVFAVVAAVVGL